MLVDQNPTEVKGPEVTQVTSEKDLGVIFDEKLIFRDHYFQKGCASKQESWTDI